MSTKDWPLEMGQKCDEEGAKYTDGIDFWDHCLDPDCMLAFLTASGYRDTDRLWKYAREIRERSERDVGYLQYDESYERAHRADSDEWGWHYAISALRYALLDQAREDGYRSITRKLWDEIYEAKMSNQAKPQSKEIAKQIAENSEVETRREQADLLRSTIEWADIFDSRKE